jgi:flagellar hook assembly protein FlgD
MTHVRRCPLAVRGTILLAALATGLAAAPAAAAAPVASRTARHVDKIAAMRALESHSGTGVVGIARTVRDALANAQGHRVPRDTVAAPTTTPSAVTLSGTGGTLTLSADSTAPYVQFSLAGTSVAAPVAVSGGTATIQVDSWGYPNGTLTASAVDCADPTAASCASTGTESTPITLANDAPVVQSPTDGATVTGGFTITATSLGGGLQFQVDGHRVGFDSTAPYAYSYSGSALSTGSHTITVVQCSTDEVRCLGPTSSVVITSDSLHPSIVSLTPVVFSPNGDRVKDTTSLVFLLPDVEAARVSVLTSAGHVVRGPLSLGTLARGQHSWTWNGRTSTGGYAATGTYRVVLDTSRTIQNVVVRGEVARSVTVDRTAPYLSGITGRGATFYPARDGYADAFVPAARMTERATVTLHILSSTSRPVRTISAVRNAGLITMSWNGTDSHGRRVAAGRYRWYLTAIDAVANRANTAFSTVVVSPKKLVAKTFTVTQNGAAAIGAGASDTSCASASRTDSQYTNGIWLVNACDPAGTTEIATAFYHFTVPGAVRYDRVNTQIGGYSLFAPTAVSSAYWSPSAGTYRLPGLYRIASSSEGWYSLGSMSGGGLIDSRHIAEVAVSVDNTYAPCDFDIAKVKFTLHYSVLQ